MHTGPNIERDGLVLGYDTGYGIADNNTPTRFYPGEPTTNLSDGGTFTSMSSYGGLNLTRVIEPLSTLGYACEMEITNSDIATAARSRFGSATNIPTSGNTFISIYVKTVGEPTSNIIPRAYTGATWATLAPLDGGSPFLTSKYRRFGVFTTMGTGSGGPNPGFSMTYGNSNRQEGQKTRWHSPQITTKTQATPYVVGTRSSTQSLIDLTKTTNIDVSNISFDSTGQPTFDGTDDSIVLTNPGVDNTTGFSIELIINPTSFSTNPMLIVPLSGGVDHWVRLGSNGIVSLRMIIAADSTTQDFSTTTPLTTNSNHHITLTFKQSEGGKAYYNGSLESSASANFTALDWTGTWRVGQRGNNTFFYQGELPVLKVYNRALSANEIQQNYNAYKSRFNI